MNDSPTHEYAVNRVLSHLSRKYFERIPSIGTDLLMSGSGMNGRNVTVEIVQSLPPLEEA